MKTRQPSLREFLEEIQGDLGDLGDLGSPGFWKFVEGFENRSRKRTKLPSQKLAGLVGQHHDLMVMDDIYDGGG